VSLSQPLFNWGAWQTYQQSKLSQATAEATFSQAQQDLIVRVARLTSTC
jgi:outer membrane protein